LALKGKVIQAENHNRVSWLEHAMNPELSIMVIGEDANFCYLMRRYVLKTKHQIVFSFLGEDVLAIAEREKPIAIIIEINASSSESWRLLQSVKSNLLTKKIPVILCSWQDEEKQSLEKGANAFLHMPILYDDFQAKLATIGIIPCQ
jgi:PleD family two-component response regulator